MMGALGNFRQALTNIEKNFTFGASYNNLFNDIATISTSTLLFPLRFDSRQSAVLANSSTTRRTAGENLAVYA